MCISALPFTNRFAYRAGSFPYASCVEAHQPHARDRAPSFVDVCSPVLLALELSQCLCLLVKTRGPHLKIVRPLLDAMSHCDREFF